jgi:hypothetical protein
VIANAVEGLDAQVEWDQCDVGAPNSMIKTLGNKWTQSIFGCVTTWTMTAVVTERNCFGERNIEPKSACNRRCDLGNLESMREASALVILWKHKHLSFACKTSKC